MLVHFDKKKIHTTPSFEGVEGHCIPEISKNHPYSLSHPLKHIFDTFDTNHIFDTFDTNMHALR